MNDFPDTRTTLLLRLRDVGDQQAWHEFAAIYEPLVYRMDRGGGLQHADALDLCQEVLLAVAGVTANRAVFVGVRRPRRFRRYRPHGPWSRLRRRSDERVRYVRTDWLRGNKSCGGQ